MKLKIVCIFFCCVAFPGSYSGQNKIDIYLSLNDCLNHFAGMSPLSKLKDFEKTIVIRRTDSLVMKELLEEFILPDVNYRYVDSSPFSAAYFKVFFNDRLADSLPLSVLPEKLKSYLKRDKKPD